MRGIELFLDVLNAAGVRRIFGNPGTTELPLNDALSRDDRFDYVLGLHEAPVMAMADGYAMASRGLGVVNLHASCGLGNAMGMLYNAYREGTPLLVTAGQQDRRLMAGEPILAGDFVSVTAPWTKRSTEVRRVEDLALELQRSIRAALTPPTGPVFLSLPVDVQMEITNDSPLPPFQMIDSATRPPKGALDQACRVLLSAERPVILAGSRVCDRDAFDELAALAEVIGAPVISEAVANHGRMAFPCNHPLRADLLPLWSPDVHRRLSEFDAAVVVGMDLLRQYVYFDPPQPIPKDLRLIHLDEDAWQIGKNAHTEVGVVGDIRVAMGELSALLTVRAEPDYQRAAATRVAEWTERHAEQRAELIREAESLSGQGRLEPLAVMKAVADVLPRDSAVVEEAVTTTNGTLERLGVLDQSDGYFAQRGWTLGWGLGCAMGAQLAWPKRTVLGILGDGSLMYGAAGLWTAAQRGLPIVVLVCNNGGYGILKSGFQTMGLTPQDGRDLGVSIAPPSIDFPMLARSMGVEGVHVESAEELCESLRAAFASDGPTLIEVPVQKTQWGG